MTKRKLSRPSLSCSAHPNVNSLPPHPPPLKVHCAGSRGEKMLYFGTDPESYITEYTVVYEENRSKSPVKAIVRDGARLTRLLLHAYPAHRG